MQHVAVVCPRCQSRYQVEPGLVGKRMRCPSTFCRAVFEVRPEGTPPAAAPPVEAPPPSRAGQSSGSVSDLLPLVPTAPVTPAPVTPTAPPDDDFPDDFPDDDDATAEAPEQGPLDAGAGTWEAPPVRAAHVERNDVPAEVPPPEPIAAPPAVKSRGSLLVIAGMLAALLALAGFTWWQFEQTRTGSERERYAAAEEKYREADFAGAAALLQQIYRDFPDSRDGKRYRFLGELSDVREAVYGRHENAEEETQALERVLQFIGQYQNDPLLKDRHADVWQTLRRLAGQLAKRAEQQHDATALRRARQAWAVAKKFQAPEGTNLADVERQLSDEFARVEQALSAYARRQSVLADLTRRLDRTTARDVQEARALVRTANLTDDAEVAGLLAKLPAAHLQALQYETAEPDEPAATVVEDALPSVAVTPARKLGTAPADGGVVLALAQGVLYALDSTVGEPRWARRVGVDTQTLPLRVPPDAITPELVLVPSSDSQSVTALVAATGEVLWQTALSSPSEGRPVLVGGSLLVPTLSGRVEEIEVSGGRRLGAYPLGQRLTLGGVRQPGTPLVYFPGDDFAVYALDTAKKTVAAVLYTGHPAGALRGLPIVLSEAQTGIPAAGPSDAGAGWLLLTQADGGEAVLVRPFALPVRDPDATPAAPPARVAGWPSFAPWHDAEKLALATDAGFLSLLGLRQKGNREDPLLFPLLGDAFHVDGGRRESRALVVHADASNYWVLARGRLHRLQATFKPDVGPGLVPRWPEPPLLGGPLHEGQHRTGPNGRATLFVTTQALDGPTVLSSAIDAETGAVLWQRQLGCTPLTPLAVAERKVLLRDPAGPLLFDAEKLPDTTDARWLQAGTLLAEEPLVNDQAALLTGEREFVELTWPASPTGPGKVRVRRVFLTGEPPAARTVELPAVPVGTPALGDGTIILPLANGVAVRLDLNDGSTVSGPDWRAVGADEQAPGHVVALGGDEFLMTDGSRGLFRLHWPTPKTWEKRADARLAHRVVSPPALIKSQEGAALAAVADASDALTLLDADRLQIRRRWQLPGKLTAGPFALGRHLGVVIDRRRLVRLDPANDAPTWEYAFDTEVVGTPRLVDGQLIVATESGQVWALDPATGNPLGPGYTFRASVAPAAAPVPFGAGRLLVPLTDGTLLLVPLEALRGEK